MLVDRQVDLPLALPGSLGHSVEGRVQAVRVIADVAVVAQQQAAGVAGLATRLAHRALQTAPPLGEDDPRDLEQSSIKRQQSHTHSHSRLVNHDALLELGTAGQWENECKDKSVYICM